MSEPTNIEPTPAPLNPDLAGYPTVDGLVQGYRASSEEGKKNRERAERAEAQLQQLLMSANQRQEVPQRPTNPSDPYSQLAEYGVPQDAFRAAVQAEIRNELQPLAAGFQARSKVLSQYPDYNKFEADVAQFINSDPQMAQNYESMFRANPEGAMEYAFLKFGDSRRRAHPSQNGEGNQDSTHAEIPTARGAGESRRQDVAGDAVGEAFQRFQQTGDRRDMERYVKARLRTVIKDEFLNA